MSLPFRATSGVFGSPDSSSDDYKNVINDLTIENKRLKRRLQKAKHREEVRPDKDRLFEVKIYDLPVGKKRELEEVLRKFAANLDGLPSSQVVHPLATSTHSARSLAEAGGKPSSSMASTRVADSGYGSMTALHQASTAMSGQCSARSDNMRTPKSHDQTIRPYLHNIPEGLLPRQQPQSISYQRLQRLVVRKMEQVFRGRGAAAGGHQQSLQQQEVSQSTAQADRSELEAQGRGAGAEGLREARIMDTETEYPMNSSNTYVAISKLPTIAVAGWSADGIDSHDFTASSTFPCAEQRPTRPLDLDPDRAQFPTENLEYFRHLGFLGHGKNGVATPSADRDDYIFLNLLMNIAQLHIVNVTADFVKTAVTEHSRNLELAADGKKIRWRGDQGTDCCSSSDAEEENFDASNRPQIGEKRQRTRHRHPTTENHAPKRVALSARTPSERTGPMHYSSVEQARIGDDCNASNADRRSEQSLQLGEHEMGESSAWTSTMKANEPVSRQKGSGSLVFYKKAPFCTDLSADMTKRSCSSNDMQSVSATTHPLGIKPPEQATFRRASSNEYDAQTLNFLAKPPSAVEINNVAGGAIAFPSQQSSPRRVTFAEPDERSPFEASGVGGVVTNDHFCFTVTMQRRLASPKAAQPTRQKLPVPAPFAAALPRKPSPEYRVVEQIMSTSKTDLDPSPLPPATMHIFSTGSDVCSGSEAISNDSAFSDSRSGSSTSICHHYNFDSLATFTRMRYPARVALQQRGILPISGDVSSSASIEPNLSGSEAGSESDDDTDDEDNQSLDFLATAREVDPDAIRAKEREYDAEMAERLAVEIPAGSSAATAGGGSGSVSPSATELEGDEDHVDRGSVSS